MKKESKYKWVAVIDNIFQNESDRLFDSKEEAYLGMKNSALDIIKHNTELKYINVSSTYIGYQIKFFKDKVIINSRNNIYTYKIEEVNFSNYFLPKFKDCKSLIGKRFNYETLENELNKLFGIKGRIKKDKEIEQCNMDYQLTYFIDEDHCFDIFFLKMRYEDYAQGNNIYITGIGEKIY